MIAYTKVPVAEVVMARFRQSRSNSDSVPEPRSRVLIGHAIDTSPQENIRLIMSLKNPAMVGKADTSLRRVLSNCLFFALLFASANAAAIISDDERIALLDLHASTNGAGWINSSGWGGAIGTECAWYGVTCAASGNSVEELSLPGNNLSGPLPSNLQDLYALKLLYLGNNALTGSIPPLAGMHDLQDFAIGSNQLTGSIPPIDSLSDLASFDAGNNFLDGGFPAISGLTMLYQFDLSDNLIAGGIPSLVNLPSLASFNVSDNQLTGSIPSLAGLSQLQSFYVSDNQLGGSMPAAPDPSALIDDASRLCPNLLLPSTSPQWDAATGSSPWYLDCTNDIIFRDGFDPSM